MTLNADLVRSRCTDIEESLKRLEDLIVRCGGTGTPAETRGASASGRIRTGGEAEARTAGPKTEDRRPKTYRYSE